jgi:Alkylmercury lyase
MEDLELRNLVYRRFVELGRAPTLDDLGTTEAALRRLHDAHMIVLEPDRPEIRMANPFSGVPTPYRVEADGRSWFANCAWDAFGIPTALGVDGHVSATCPDCGEPIEIDLVGGRPESADAVFHVLVPARSWWDDIVFT